LRLLAPELTAALESVGRMTSDHTGRPDFCFDRPGSLIAALPAVLGFVLIWTSAVKSAATAAGLNRRSPWQSQRT
jgi:hypothetical protein